MATETTDSIKLTPNEKQQECIDNINGRYLVLAGPGTGKTFTIIERIKNMLKNGVDADKILCLTFTDAAANEIKKRIEAELNLISCNIAIFTYHSFCSSLIEEFLEEFEIPQNYKIITDPVSKALIKECIDEINPVYFRTDKNDPYYYINTIKRQINAIKQNRLTKEQYFKNIQENEDWEPLVEKYKNLIEEARKKNRGTITNEGHLESVVKKINQAKELWTFYELYSEKMNNARYIDFNDMINMCLEKFESNPAFIHKVANRYKYLMVDEYQDTNKSQNEIVFFLTKNIESQNVFVVGDDDQIIYRFQGAKLDTIQTFLNTFKDTKIICLTNNMRSTQPILDAARGIIAQDPLSLINTLKIKDKNGKPITKNLTAVNKELKNKIKPVRFYKYADSMQESTEIVNEIENIINSKECPINLETGEKSFSQIAILTRSNAELQGYADLLKQKNIPYELKEGKNIFTIPAVNVLYFYIQFLINPHMHSFRIFQLLVTHPFNIDPIDYQLLFNKISMAKTFIDVLRNMDIKEFKDAKKLINFLETYDYLNEYRTKENIKNTILEIGAKTGIFDYYLNTKINRTESIAGLKKFIDEASGFSDIYKTSSLEEFYTYLKAIIDDEEAINTDKSPVPLNAVQLSTYHSSKGREFEYVYMPNLITTNWESNSKSLKPEIPLDPSEYKNEDQLKNEIKPSDLTKLMYVAMTRAKHTLRMSYPDTINGKQKKATKYLVEIQDIFEKESVPFEYDETSYWEQAKNLLIKKEYDYKKDFRNFINAIVGDRAFSQSSINSYIACPRKYLYNDLLEFESKDGNPNFLSYGIAIHKACENALNYIQNNDNYPTKEDVINWFKEELSKQSMESYKQRENFKVRGEIALDKYYCQILNTTKKSLVAQEFKLEYTMEDGTKFIGFIDRIDKNEDGTFTIYDYKTGKNKNSEIKIGGKHEDYHNQMAWYKYFYEQKTGCKVTKCKFIYPEDFSSKNNEFIFTDSEMQEAINKFKNAVNGINNCEFEPTYNENACKYCNCKDFCGMNIL